MNRKNRKDNMESNYMYPQPYIDPMVYLNPYYQNSTGYPQGYMDYSQFNNGYIDYSQFNDNNMDANYSLGGEEYTNIEPEDFNIPSIPYYPPGNMPGNMPQMILPNAPYQGLPPNMGMPNGQNTNNSPQQPDMSYPTDMNMYYPQPANNPYPQMVKPMYPANMFPNMFPNMYPGMMYPGMMLPNMYPFVNMGPDMSNINMEEFDEEEM